MSLLATPLALLVFFSGFALAQIVSPNCESTWAWSFNSLNQDPCKVAATMMGTCNGGEFTIRPLQQGYRYFGPSGVDDSNLCKCSTVGYSLISACGGCQGGDWITWSEYSFNCTTTLPPSQFPNPVPTGIRVPHWALLDVTNDDLWDFNKSYAAGDSPEVAPVSTPSPSNPSSYPSSTSSSPPSSTSTSGLKRWLIASVIVGGIATISLLVVALFFYRRRRRSLTSFAALPVAESAGDSLSAYVALNSPILSHIPSPASFGKDPYTLFPVRSPEPHKY